jgi:hypothetical protein
MKEGAGYVSKGQKHDDTHCHNIGSIHDDDARRSNPGLITGIPFITGARQLNT